MLIIQLFYYRAIYYEFYNVDLYIIYEENIKNIVCLIISILISKNTNYCIIILHTYNI